MKRVGFILKLKPDKIEEYLIKHEHPWPEQIEALKRNGWHNYTLFLRKDGLLFGYFETPDSFEAALQGMAKEEVNLKWQEYMRPFFEVPEGARPDQTMLELEEIAHVD